MTQLTKREQIAAMAMQGLLSNPDWAKTMRTPDDWDEYTERLTGASVEVTDSLLKHLAETEPVEKEMKGNDADAYIQSLHKFKLEKTVEHELPKASNLGNHGAKYKDVAIGDLILIMDKADYSNLISIGAIFMPLWKIVMPVPSECKFPIYLERTADGDFYREKPDAKGAIYGFEHGDFKKLNSGYVGVAEEKPKDPDSKPMNAFEIADWLYTSNDINSEDLQQLTDHILALVQYELNKAKR